MEFEYPYAFLLIPLFIVCSFVCKPKNAQIYFFLFEDKKQILTQESVLNFFKWLGIFSLIIALASPIFKEAKTSTKPAHAVVMLLDTSESMIRTSRGFFGADVPSQKFEKAKQIASEYIKKRVNDHVGVIVFGDFAYVATPLSFDNKSTTEILKHLQQGVAGDKTAMYDALFLSTRLLKESKAKQKVAILLTDGFNTSGNIPLEVALRAIKSENLKVFTIGLGREGEFDKESLKLIATQSGGKFFHAKDVSELSKVYEEIDKIQLSKLETKSQFHIDYWYSYFLFVSLFNFLFYLLFLKRRSV